MSWTVYNSSGQLLQATDLPDDVVGVAELSATGTASSSTFLRGDNAWAAPSGGPSQATQGALEAETNEDTYVPPDLVVNSPGVAKAWAHFSANGSIQENHNVASITDNGVGDWTVVIATDFSSSDECCFLMPRFTAALHAIVVSEAVGSVPVKIFAADHTTAADPNRIQFLAFGDR